jgi:hypothetical protein
MSKKSPMLKSRRKQINSSGASSETYRLALQIHEEKQKLEYQLLNLTDDFGNTALHYLALYGWLDGTDLSSVPTSAWLVKNLRGFAPAQYVRREHFSLLPPSKQIEEVLELRGSEYWVTQDKKELETKKPPTTHLELF